MTASTRGTATSRVTIRTSPRNSLTFLRDQDYRRHLLGLTPEGYRPTLGQMRLTRNELRFVIQLLPGGKG
jgi:hypothetical protein